MALVRGLLTACALAVVGGSAGCAGHAGPPYVPPAPPVSTRSQTQLLAPDASKTMLYVAQGDGVHVYTSSGKPVETYATATGANEVVMDDKGNSYVLYSQSASTHVVRYKLGKNKPSATYQPSQPNVGGAIFASHAGELVYAYFFFVGSQITSAYDVWDPGVTGAPSRTFTHVNSPSAIELTVGMTPNGALYIPYYDANTQTQRYDVFLPRKSKPKKTIVDTLVTGSEAAAFQPSWLAVDKNGTLFVGEWNYNQSDSLAGLYVYNGEESVITAGASNPTGLGIDGSGNVYVLNSNLAFATSGETCDTLHTLSVFAPGGGGMLSQAASGFTNGQSLTVASNGTSYIGEAAYAPSQSCDAPQGIGAIGRVLTGKSSGKTLISDAPNLGVVIFDGKHAINPGSQAL